MASPSLFIEYLKKGEFVVPVCTSCGQKAWPPSPTCPKCFGRTALKKVGKTGTLAEFATSHVRGHEGVFGIVEMDGFRLVGSLDGDKKLRKGVKVKMDRCGVNAEGAPFYHFTLTTAK
ncbi:putative nucleic-acid-binding protein containing a Zn-ribbon [Candidatus Nitrososphaera evergladensis SR1]|uniref:Putative nucleic-acid-binding protein containing a Zn-ribbon n=1 Tax=Candidatus Nitrososphaera evergladensis SR1 TaxID=1459636 RepID=A0A075MSW2_9ARCH|nr:zinc ribbon domain-containing protein [Candidatus Nitrososphaera evergladensis]AIF83877.1 putative nucleic-acid-binding protein containing a Zn-ribbon [Candidatus Nitrososphaera evergladensis SR1]